VASGTCRIIAEPFRSTASLWKQRTRESTSASAPWMSDQLRGQLGGPEQMSRPWRHAGPCSGFRGQRAGDADDADGGAILLVPRLRDEGADCQVWRPSWQGAQLELDLLAQVTVMPLQCVRPGRSAMRRAAACGTRRGWFDAPKVGVAGRNFPAYGAGLDALPVLTTGPDGAGFVAGTVTILLPRARETCGNQPECPVSCARRNLYSDKKM